MKRGLWLGVILLAALGIAGWLTLDHLNTSNVSGTVAPPAEQAATVLLFEGEGTSHGDASAIRTLLRKMRVPFRVVNSSHLDALSADKLRNVKLLIVPGGNYEQMGNGLKPETAAHVRDAVNGGMNYLGICAGAFMAGDSPYNGFNLTGVRFPFYAAAKQGIRKQLVKIDRAGGAAIKTYWEDGPAFNGWGETLARYPDGTGAVVQGRVGKGWVLLTGVHLEAPEPWYDDLEEGDWAIISNSYALKLFRAALDGARLHPL